MARVGDTGLRTPSVTEFQVRRPFHSEGMTCVYLGCCRLASLSVHQPSEMTMCVDWHAKFYSITQLKNEFCQRNMLAVVGLVQFA